MLWKMYLAPNCKQGVGQTDGRHTQNGGGGGGTVVPFGQVCAHIRMAVEIRTHLSSLHPYLLGRGERVYRFGYRFRFLPSDNTGRTARYETARHTAYIPNDEKHQKPTHARTSTSRRPLQPRVRHSIACGVNATPFALGLC